MEYTPSTRACHSAGAPQKRRDTVLSVRSRHSQQTGLIQQREIVVCSTNDNASASTSWFIVNSRFIVRRDTTSLDTLSREQELRRGRRQKQDMAGAIRRQMEHCRHKTLPAGFGSEYKFAYSFIGFENDAFQFCYASLPYAVLRPE